MTVKEGTVGYPLRLPKELYEKVVEKAKADNRTVNNWLNVIIEKAVKEDAE